MNLNHKREIWNVSVVIDHEYLDPTQNQSTPPRIERQDAGSKFPSLPAPGQNLGFGQE
jgi:hypothetical protein